MAARCQELIVSAERPSSTAEQWAASQDAWRCGAPAEPVPPRTTTVHGDRLSDLGRSNVRCGPYCAEHGGRARAEAEQERAWQVQAPASVGDEYQVQRVGCWGLSSLDVYVVVRPYEGRWVAALGIGGQTRQLRGSWAEAWDAVEAGSEVWRQQVDRDVAAIREARAESAAYEDGYRDGLDWDLDGFANREELERETEDWDETTINAIGGEECKRVWGVESDDYEAWDRACRDYNAGAYAGATAPQEQRTGKPHRGETR